MTKEQAIEFLVECSTYFGNLPDNGEDRTFWANAFNSDNCKKIARHLENNDFTKD